MHLFHLQSVCGPYVNELTKLKLKVKVEHTLQFPSNFEPISELYDSTKFCCCYLKLQFGGAYEENILPSNSEQERKNLISVLLHLVLFPKHHSE